MLSTFVLALDSAFCNQFSSREKQIMMVATRTFCEPVSIVASHDQSNRPRNRSRLVGLCAVLALMLCASWSILSAQTVSGNFGNVNVGTASPAIPLVFTFNKSDILGSTAVLTQGATGLDFTDAGSDTCTANTAYSAGQTCTVNVTFTPMFSGSRSGAVVLVDSTGNTIATGLVQGTGVGPQILFHPGTQSVLGSGLGEPASVAVDGSGDLYFTAVGSSVLREMLAVNGVVPASPTIKTIASGFGTVAFVTVDGSGNLYVADTLNNAVKEILAVNGSIPASPTIKILGSGFSYPADIAVDGSGNVYVTGLVDNTVKEMLAVNGSIPASPTIKTLGSGFHEPIGITVDASGDVYVGDSGNNAVKEMLAVNGSIPASPTIKTLGSGFSMPYTVAFDGSGNLYVADYGNNAVKEMLAVNGSIPASPTIETLGSGFFTPSSAVLDGSGNVYVADSGNNRVVKLDFADPPSLTFASTAVGATSTDSPQTITVVNAGNAELTFPIPSTGNNPSMSAANFTLNSSGSSDCELIYSVSSTPGTLAAGASCQLPISFVPTAVGALTGSLVLTDNNLNAAEPAYASQNITLSGPGTGSFTLASSASSLTMIQGGSGTSTITVTGQYGFTGSVNLTASGLPSGVTASFSPNPATGASLLTLSAIVGSSEATSQPITITGTSGSLTETTSLLLTVNPGPSFSIGASPSVMNLNQGASGTSTIAVTGYYGFTGNVSLAITSSLPNGVTASISPNSTTGTSVLTMNAISGYAHAGTYKLTISGTSPGQLTAISTVTVIVNPPTFTLIASAGDTSLNQGASLTSTIWVSPLAGFAGSVNLAVTGLTSGLTASITPNPSTGTSVLTLTASTTATPGNALVAVTGTSGTETESTYIEVGIAYVAPGFSLANSTNPPTSGPNIVQGASGTSTITVTDLGDFSSSVNLAVSGGLPSGVTASFSQNPTNTTSVLTLTASSSATLGPYYTTITGTSGALTATTGIYIFIYPAPGLAPLSANFGSVNIGTASPVQTLTYTFATFAAPVTLGSMAVLTQGAAGLDFANAGTGTCTPNTTYTASQSCTVNVTFTPSVAGTRNGAAVLYGNTGNVIATDYIQGNGVGPQVNYLPGTQSIAYSGTAASAPQAIAVDGSGNLYLGMGGAGTVSKEAPSAGGYTSLGTVGSGLHSAYGIAVDGSGNIYIADYAESVYVETPSPGGYTQSMVVTGLAYPNAVAVDGSGNVYIADSGPGLVLRETPTPNGYLQSEIPTSGISSLGGVAVDGSGNVYITDVYNGRVVEETPSGVSYTQSTVVSGLGQPQGIAVDGSGNLYIVDLQNNQVVKETATPGGYVQSAVANNAINGLLQPLGVAVDASGNVYIAETNGFQVLKENFADPPSLAFASTAVGSTSTDSPQTITLENVGNAALNFPIPATGSNPSIGTNFTWNSSGASACPLVTSNSWTYGTLAAGSSCQLTISFTPTVAGTVSSSLVLTDNDLNAAAPGYINQTLALNGVGTQVTPTITWATPAAITYGTALSAVQLNASSTVAGTFVYSPLAGVVPTAGSQTLSVTLNPTDSTDYTTATATVTLVVNKATPAITWATPAAIAYGTALSATQLNASSTVAGTFTYSPAAGTVLAAGSQTLTATFTPTDTVDYSTATATVNLAVNKAAPTITWATPAAVTYGTALNATQLNATSTVAGTFAYSPAAGTVPTAGSKTLSVTLNPTDSTDYTTATATVTLVVNKATPAITWATPAAIAYGTALSATQLNASSNVAGTFTYSPAAGTVLAAGSQTLTATFMPTDTVDYTTATASVNLAVNKAAPTITWVTPTAIAYGTALSAVQLNATSTVAGTFTYSPAAGTVLTAGSQTLTTTFTPTDTLDYTTATASVNLAVNKAAPTITWVTPAAIAYGTALSATQLDASSNVAGTFTYSPAAGTVLAAGSQTLTTTFTPTDTVDYTTATATVVLTVNPAPSFTLGASPGSLTVVQGSSGTSTLTVTKLNGFTGSVTLAASGLPSGVTATFGTNPTTGTSVLTLKASSSATLGSAPVTIKGTSGSLTASTTIALTISCSPTPIVPYIYVNSAWTEESSVTVSSPTTVVDLGPQPSSGGTWNWSGPNGYSSTSRQINSIPLTVGTDSYLATYTNASGCKSTETFTITVK
jgi:sugar lactone lactonase YvrE